MEQTAHNVTNDDLIKSYLYFKKEYSAQQLVEQNPTGKPNFPLKQIIYNTSNQITSQSPQGKKHDYNVIVSRWKALALNGIVPGLGDQKTKFVLQENVYDYTPILENSVEWHVNFAGTALLLFSTI